MVCLYFTISGQGSLATPQLTAQAMLLNGLALGPLNFVTLQAIRVLFDAILFGGFARSPGPVSSSLHAVHTHGSSSIPLNSRAAQSGT